MNLAAVIEQAIAEQVRLQLAEGGSCSCGHRAGSASATEVRPPSARRAKPDAPAWAAHPEDDAASLIARVWLTTAEAADYTGRHPGTVRAAAAAEALRSTQAGRGRGRRYRREWLDAWIAGPGAVAVRQAPQGRGR